jgi:hypothetical protein
LQNWIPLIVALIAAATALTGYLVNGAASRRSQKARYYADALSAVEKHYSLSFIFRRRHDSTKETRAELANMLTDIQVKLAFYQRWLELDSPAVGAAYNRLVEKIREKNQRRFPLRGSCREPGALAERHGSPFPKALPGDLDESWLLGSPLTESLSAHPSSTTTGGVSSGWVSGCGPGRIRGYTLRPSTPTWRWAPVHG